MNRISRLTALLLAVLLFLSSVTAAAEGLSIGGASGLTIEDWEQLVNSAEGTLLYTEEGDTGKEVIPESPELPEQSAYYPYTGATELTLTQGDTAAEAYITASEVAVLTCADAGQWQIDRGAGFVSLKGETGTALNVSAAMVGGDSASFRKGLGTKDAQTGAYAAYTQTAVVSIIESAAVYSLSREAESTGNDGIMTLEAANQENMIIVEVAYVIKGTDQPVADSYVGQIAKKSTLSTILTLPKVTGYLAAECSIDEGSTTVIFTPQTADAAGAITLNVTAAESVADITIRVQYEPTDVNFTVRHFQQNVDNDGYTEVTADKETRQGLTGAPVGAGLQKSYAGFQHIWYDPTTAIAADGSTVVEIYYNREYYMMTFDLGGGYGVEPIYARYGAAVGAIDAPKRTGYAFVGWATTEELAEAGTADVTTLPVTIPAAHTTYYAVWTVADTTFTVQYWLEDPNNPGVYDVWYSKPVEAKAEATIYGVDHKDVDSAYANEAKYYNFAACDESVVVAGDGSTTLNVYYNRNNYTLRFYYARLKGNTYQVATSTDGSSNNGGTVVKATWGADSTTKPDLEIKTETDITGQALYTEQAEDIDGKTYYYFELTAKYGQNIADIWPAAPINGKHGNYNFISWGTHYGSGYYDANSNKNIKGPYSTMDAGLLIDPTKTADQGVNHWMVGYWRTNPTMYTYEIYYSLLDGETEDRNYNNKGYKKQTDYTVGSTDYPSGQTALTFEGVTFVGKDYDVNEKIDGTAVRFYYTRNIHAVTFNNQFSSTTEESMTYGESLTGLADTEPVWPDGYDESHTFGGWYKDAACTQMADFTITMPDKPLEFFAKWSINTYTVNFYESKEALDAGKLYVPAETDTAATFTVEHGKTIENTFVDNYLDDTSMEALDDRVFAGWYYLDESGNEMRFDIDTMPVTSNMDIYAKWSYTDPVAFTFYFQHENDLGTEVYLASPYTGQALPNTPVTLSAKIGDELTLAPKQDNLLGYIPYVNSHTIVLDVDETKNVYTFVYQEPAEVSYTVQYLVAGWVTDDNGNQVLAPVVNADGSYTHLVDEKTETTKKAVVTENYVPVINYMPHATQLRLIVGMEESLNVLQFLYVVNTTDAPYSVTHYVTDHAGVKTVARSETNKTGKIGETVSVEKLSLTGYAFAYAKVAVPTQNADGTWTDVMYDPTVRDDAVQYALPQAGMHVYLYYEPVKYPFKVQYINAATNEVIRTKIAEEDEYKAYGSTLNTADYVITIEDYRFVRFDPATWTVDVETNFSDPTVNVLNIYYDLDVADITITKEIAVSQDVDAPKPTEEQMNTAFEFTVTLTNASKEQANAYVTIDDVTQTMPVTNGTLTFTLTDGQTAVIHDLWVGTQYTIVETETADFKTSYVGDAAGTLTALGAEVTVINTFPKYSGELIIKKAGLKDTKESAIVHVDVGGVDYYLVLNDSNGYTATITGIKPGTDYTVSEVTDWTWQYTDATGSTRGMITETDIRQTVTITNTYNGDKWMHDESHVSNDFGTAESTGVNN